jgi:hypothetical protein
VTTILEHWFMSPYAPAVVILIGAFMVAGGGFWQAIRQSQSNAAQREFNTALNAKNEAIIALQHENIAQLTGADSFCSVDTTFSARDRISFMLKHHGTHPVTDVTVQIRDSADTERVGNQMMSGQLPSDGFNFLTLATKTFTAGTMVRNMGRLLVTMPYDGKRRNFFVDIFTRNASYHEEIAIMRLSDGSDVVDAHLFQRGGDNGETEIWSQVSDAFPRK